jgi:lipopolysaccharide transport system permease protein
MTTLPSVQNDEAVATVVIRGADSRWSLQWPDLWRHRELLYFLAWRDIKVRYKQTVLGVAWVVLQPLAIALSLNLFLGRLVGKYSGDLPYPVFVYSGMVVWQLFAQALIESSNSLLASQHLISKVYFPRLLVPVSTILSSLLDFVVSLFVLALFLITFHIVPTASIVLFPFMALLAAMVALGLGFWLSALNVKYRDVRYTVSFLVQFWFLATPIAYPSGIVPERWRVWYELNPMVGVVNGFRWTLHGSGTFPAREVAISVCVAMAFFLSGLYYFKRTEDNFADFI